MIDYFLGFTPQTQAAIIAALTALLTTMLSFVTKGWIEKRIHLNKLESEYRYEQQKNLKAILSKNKMRLLNAGESLNHRLWNNIENHSENWLSSRGNYYYSFVYRFVSFFAYIRQIEKELIYIDSTFAGKKDLEFIKFLRTFPQLFSDTTLFDGENYDNNFATDHFFRNNFEQICEAFIKNNEVISYSLFKENISIYEHENDTIFSFFDNITVSENRFRFDLLQTFHLTLIAFLNSYGYDFQETTMKQVGYIIENPRKSRLLKNYKQLLIRNKLSKNVWIKKFLKKKHFA